MHTSEIVMIQTDTQTSFYYTYSAITPQVLGLATGAEARDTLTGWAREVSLSYGSVCKEAQAHRQAEKRETDARDKDVDKIDEQAEEGLRGRCVSGEESRGACVHACAGSMFWVFYYRGRWRLPRAC